MMALAIDKGVCCHFIDATVTKYNEPQWVVLLMAWGHSHHMCCPTVDGCIDGPGPR